LKKLWKILKTLSGSSPIFALSNHTTRSQTQTGATVPLIRQPHRPQLTYAAMLSTGPGLAVSPPWRLVDITVAHIFLPSSAFYVHIDSPLFIAYWDTGALGPGLQMLLYSAQTAGGRLITSFLLHWPEH
jgi:hypothetical protein